MQLDESVKPNPAINNTIEPLMDGKLFSLNLNGEMEYVALLGGWCRKLATDKDTENTNRTITEALTELTGAKNVWISIYEDNSGNYRYYAKENPTVSFNASPFETGNDPLDWCMGNKEALITDDSTPRVNSGFPLSVLAGGDILGSVICHPVFYGGVCAGAVCMGSRGEGAFTHWHQQMASAIMPCISMALENAGLRKQLQAAQQLLVQSEKMASLGQLTAGIAHEINNPVNFISGGIDALRQNYQDIKGILVEYLELDADADNTEKIRQIQQKQRHLGLGSTIEEVAQLYSSIKNGAQRTTEIVKSLRNFSRLDEDVLKKASIEECLDSTLVILRSQMKERVEVIRDYSHVPEIFCYPGQLNQVFINILNNAAQAIEGKGTIWVATSAVDGMIEIRIKDSGKGIPDEVKNKIFEPFFTTKDVGIGTGLGLSISYGIIEKHKGSIRVESTAGQGAEFIIRIPANLLE